MLYPAKPASVSTGLPVALPPCCAWQSLYSWGGSGTRRPCLTRLPEGIVTEALPRLSHLTYLQLGARQVPPSSQLTRLSGTLRLLSLFEQGLPAGGLPAPPARVDWAALESYSADWDFSGERNLAQVRQALAAPVRCRPQAA